MKTMLEDYLSEHEWAMLFIIFILLILNWHAFDTGTNPTRTWHYDQDTFNELVSDGYVEKEIYFFSFYYKNELTKVKILAYLFPVNEGLQKLRKAPWLHSWVDDQHQINDTEQNGLIYTLYASKKDMTPYIVRTSDEVETKGPLPARIFTFLREHQNDRMVTEFDNHFSH